MRRNDYFIHAARRRKRLGDLTMIIFLLVVAIVVIAGLYVQVQALYHCGWSSHLVFGKQLGWAYLTGYCGG